MTRQREGCDRGPIRRAGARVLELVDLAAVMTRGKRAPARRVLAAVTCATVLAACTSPRPASQSHSATDPVAAAITAQLSPYTIADQVRAIIVTVNGHTRFERYYNAAPSDYQNIMSVTKSITSTLIGIAIGEGRLRLDETLARMLPRYATRMRPSVARVTLRQLLTMTGGFPDTWNGAGEDALDTAPDRTRYILTHQDTTPGRTFHYSDYGVQLLSPILTQATGESVLAYAREKLFTPLGITTTTYAPPEDHAHIAEYLAPGFAWPADPHGFNTTAAWLKLRPRDLATIGQLLLHDGQWNGQQIVPTSWIQHATTTQAGPAFTIVQAPPAFDPANYGYLWWVEQIGGHPAYYAHGLGGQLLEVVPAEQLVIVMSVHLDISNANAPLMDPGTEQNIADAIVTAVGHTGNP